MMKQCNIIGIQMQKITMSTTDIKKKPLEDFLSLPYYIDTVLGVY